MANIHRFIHTFILTFTCCAIFICFFFLSLEMSVCIVKGAFCCCYYWRCYFHCCCCWRNFCFSQIHYLPANMCKRTTSIPFQKQNKIDKSQTYCVYIRVTKDHCYCHCFILLFVLFFGFCFLTIEKTNTYLMVRI